MHFVNWQYGVVTMRAFVIVKPLANGNGRMQETES
jgi:hypothetical protein